MNPRIVVYQLRSKFVSRQTDIPDDARQVVYYSLAIGHHVGVLDCFSPVSEIPLDEFYAWLDGLPAGAGRTKLEGLVRWGEIEINHSHAPILLPLLETVPPGSEWVNRLRENLRVMLQEPAFYLMLRKKL